MTAYEGYFNTVTTKTAETFIDYSHAHARNFPPKRYVYRHFDATLHSPG